MEYATQAWLGLNGSLPRWFGGCCSRALQCAFQLPVQRGDIDGYDKFNREFHEIIYGATHNAFMAEQALAIRNRLKAFRRTQLRHGTRLARSREEHEAILNAIAQGEGDEASRRMRAHMLNAASAIGRYIATQTRKDG